MLSVIAIAGSCSLRAQFTSEPQASSQEEYDEYLSLATLTDPAAIIKSGGLFEKAFPNSAMLSKVYRRELDAWKSLGNARMAIFAGEKALQLLPENIDVMSELAYLIADTDTDSASLRKARSYGMRVLELLDTLQIPRTITPQEWSGIRASLEYRAHTALGLVAFKSGLLHQSIAEFELALRADTNNNGSILYRLGVAYRLAGLQDKAREILTKAKNSGDPFIRERAEKELSELHP